MGELTEKVKALILSLQISSASPGHINEVLQLDPTIDLDSIEKKDDGGADSLFGKDKKKGKKATGKSKQLANLIGSTDGQAGNLINFAKNPSSMLSGVMGALGKTLPFIAVITAVIALPKVIKKIGDFLTQKGGPFDRFLKVLSTDANNAFYSRLEQRNLQIGKRQVIFTNNKGFRNSGGALTGNSFKGLGLNQNTAAVDIGTSKIASIVDKAEGL